MGRFIIVGTQRTGSTLVGALLNKHPDVFCGWEWTQRLPFRLKFKAVERAFESDFSLLGEPERDHIQRIYKGQERWIGFRRLFRSSDKWLFHPAFSPALFADRFEGHIKWIAARPELHVIHIVRRDNLDWVKSKELSRLTQAYAKRAYPDGIQVKVRLSEARRRLKSKAWVDGRLASLSETNPYCRMIYEELVSNKDCERARLLSFLDCDMSNYQYDELPIQRQSKGKSEDYVTNLEQLRAALEAESLLWSAV